MKIINTIFVITLVAMASYGCSSSGGGSTPTPNGIYSGSITGGEPSFNGIEEKAVIYSGRLMVLSIQADGPAQIFDGTISENNTALSGDGIRYSAAYFEPNGLVDYSGSYVHEQSATIDFTEAAGSNVSLPPGTINLTKSSSLSSKGSSTEKLAGVWTGNYSNDFNSPMTLSIDSSGTIISGGDDAPADCVLSGTITPADSAMNIYNTHITSDGGSISIGNSGFTCILPAAEYTGLAWTEGDTDGTLILIFTNGTNSRAVVLTKN